MASTYVLQDRTTATKWGLFVSDGQLGWDATLDPAQPEPILEDRVTGAHWQWFLDDGQLGIEATATVQDDLVQLDDAITSLFYKLVVDDGQLGWEAFTPAAGGEHFHILRRGCREGVLVGIR